MNIGTAMILIFFAAFCWGVYELAIRPVQKEKQNRQEKEKQLRYKRIEQQYALEQQRKKAEELLEEQRAAEQKRQEERRVAEAEKSREIRERIRKQIEEKHAEYDRVASLIQEYPVTVSEDRAPKVPASFINDLTFSTITKKSNMDKLGDFVAIDTETTGLRYTSDEIIDIAAIRFRGFQPVAKFSTLVAPSKPIPPAATEVNRIDDAMVAGCPCFQQVAGALLEFVGEDNIVGHNLPFDLKFVVHYGADMTTKKRKYFDTLEIAKKTIKKTKKKWDRELEDYIEDYDSDGISDYKLGTLCSYFGILHIDAHRAEGDALAAGMLFHKLAEIRTGQMDAGI